MKEGLKIKNILTKFIRTDLEKKLKEAWDEDVLFKEESIRSFIYHLLCNEIASKTGKKYTRPFLSYATNIRLVANTDCRIKIKKWKNCSIDIALFEILDKTEINAKNLLEKDTRSLINKLLLAIEIKELENISSKKNINKIKEDLRRLIGCKREIKTFKHKSCSPPRKINIDCNSFFILFLEEKQHNPFIFQIEKNDHADTKFNEIKKEIQKKKKTN